MNIRITKSWCERRLLQAHPQAHHPTLLKQSSPSRRLRNMWTGFSVGSTRARPSSPSREVSLDALRKLDGFRSPRHRVERHSPWRRRVSNYDPRALDTLCMAGVVGWVLISRTRHFFAGGGEHRPCHPYHAWRLSPFPPRDAHWMTGCLPPHPRFARKRPRRLSVHRWRYVSRCRWSTAPLSLPTCLQLTTLSPRRNFTMHSGVGRRRPRLPMATTTASARFRRSAAANPRTRDDPSAMLASNHPRARNTAPPLEPPRSATTHLFIPDKRMTCSPSPLPKAPREGRSNQPPSSSSGATTGTRLRDLVSARKPHASLARPPILPASACFHAVRSPRRLPRRASSSPRFQGEQFGSSRAVESLRDARKDPLIRWQSDRSSRETSHR